ncbi:MAG TPA: DNA mismatch repair protein MutS [Gemmatimonadaceae bacterium]|nr:DNA mismatch repair protein MutS [Gemmatimonadaceae bacterium]
MSAGSTPLMQQYREIKGRHQDAILFFRMGDFYEMFYDDAETAARVLGLTLTSRNNGGAAEVPLAGVPVKAVNEYLRRLVQQGFRVAICEQVEDPKTAKGIVKREVIETITPGAAFADDLLDGRRNNFLCALHAVGDRVGVAAADLSTGEFRLATAGAGSELDTVLSRFAPREILVPGNGPAAARRPRVDEALVTERDAWEFDPALARDDLADHFGVLTLDGFGLGGGDDAALGAAGALLRYLRELQPAGLPQLAPPRLERAGLTMPLDEMTRRNLELVEPLRGDVAARGDVSGTLLGVLDRTRTPMGARLLRQWLLAPLLDRREIDARLDAVAALVEDALARDALGQALDGVRDVERLASKAAAGRATPRELGALGASVARLPEVERALRRLAEGGEDDASRGGPPPNHTIAPAARGTSTESPPAVPPPLDARRSTLATHALHRLLAAWDGCADVATALQDALVDRPPVAIGEEETIRAGVDPELDELRALCAGGKDAIAGIQEEERRRTGIGSLKVGFNRVFGYYIEVTNANRHLVPDDYQRRQTLTGAERYVTPALKAYEERVLTASERIEARERELFEALRARVGGEIRRLQCVAAAVAELDVLASFAEVAAREGYVRPVVTDDFALDIAAGRHPVVERMMPREKFIPNDVRLTEDARLVILTGPNMAGKSTILRQVGLIVLMAQVGCFVPAARATVGVVDRLFTRVGASDNLVRGQSTFMVEMSETSAILHTATARSLVLLDEIGRGTSTYDGVSIAWAVSEHLHERIGCKTIFATHYHELTQLADELPAVRNLNVGVREVGDQILFLHRLQPGGADRSYGIEVGRLAGLPDAVLARAREVLHVLEQEALVDDERRAASGERRGRAGGRRTPRSEPAADQLALFAPAEPHPVVERLRALDPNALTPLQALTLLAELAERARG